MNFERRSQFGGIFDDNRASNGEAEPEHKAALGGRKVFRAQRKQITRSGPSSQVKVTSRFHA
jgi:hypothetical protein